MKQSDLHLQSCLSKSDLRVLICTNMSMSMNAILRWCHWCRELSAHLDFETCTVYRRLPNYMHTWLGNSRPLGNNSVLYIVAYVSARKVTILELSPLHLLTWLFKYLGSLFAMLGDLLKSQSYTTYINLLHWDIMVKTSTVSDDM